MCGADYHRNLAMIYGQSSECRWALCWQMLRALWAGAPTVKKPSSFPPPDHYRQFRNALGRTPQFRLPVAGIDALLARTLLRVNAPDALGNVRGQQMLLTAPLTLPNGDKIAKDTLGDDLPFVTAAIGTATPSIAGWMHAQVLINALAEGGTPTPLWMREGLGALSAWETLRATNLPQIETASEGAARAYLAQQTTFLLPRDFALLAQKVNTGSQLDSVATAQSMRMMRFFYDRFGSGAVVETLQRLGAGQNIDAALNTTTGLNQNAFFAAWRAAESGA